MSCPYRDAGSAYGMSEYSRWVEARGTISIESTPAWCHASNPVAFSRFGSGASCGECGCGWNDDEPSIQYGSGSNPYSDCTASAGTTGCCRPCGANPLEKNAPGSLVSLSNATSASTRGSTACTYDTAAAPSEWPMMATRV